HKEFLDKVVSPAGVRFILFIGAVIFWFLSKFLFVVFVLLFLIACIKPEWIFRHKKKIIEKETPPKA
ncbi:hypothetical protein KAU34_04310, partial [candidate division WOR-3 bacterium]|nr:hypothetical protein [candidate division WOR-3 bacterium]